MKDYRDHAVATLFGQVTVRLRTEIPARQRFAPASSGCGLTSPISRQCLGKNATPAQLSLAWLLARRPFIVPIPCTRNPDHLIENLGAINVQLTAEDLRAIDTAVAKIKVHGGRMNPMQMEAVDRSA